MRAEVIKAYTDRETGRVRLAGDEVELTETRLAELSAGGYVRAAGAVESAEPEPADEAGADPAKEPATRAEAATDLASMTNAQLKEYIESRGGEAPKKANKAALFMIAEAL